MLIVAEGELPLHGYDPVVSEVPLPYNLRGIREWAGLTQQQAAEQLWLDPTQILRFESGERTPNAETIADYIQVFDLDYHQSTALIEIWEHARGR